MTRRPSLDFIAKALVAQDKPSSRDEYAVLALQGHAVGDTCLAKAHDGTVAFLVPLGHSVVATVRMTSGLTLRTESDVLYRRATRSWRAPSAIIECREPGLITTFVALSLSIAARLRETGTPTWERVSSLFSEWEGLLQRRSILDPSALLGLWGELWCIARSKDPDRMVASWRGPEADKTDFLLAGQAFEVKTSRALLRHHVSQSQVDSPFGNVIHSFLSLHVAIDPLHGSSVPELVAHIGDRVVDVAAMEEGLAKNGYFRADAEAYASRMTVVRPPLLFADDAIPRVRQMDDGISLLRYRVELSSDRALVGAELDARLAAIGLDLHTLEFPCA